MPASHLQALVHFAAAEGRLDLMQQLLGQSCAVDELNQEGLTPLQVAALRGDSALVRLLLAHGARPNVAAAKGKTSDLAPGATASGASLRQMPRAAVTLPCQIHTQ